MAEGRNIENDSHKQEARVHCAKSSRKLSSSCNFENYESYRDVTKVGLFVVVVAIRDRNNTKATVLAVVSPRRVPRDGYKS